MYGHIKAQKTTVFANLCAILSLYNNLTCIMVNIVQNKVKFA
jgi:hypothetical protein